VASAAVHALTHPSEDDARGVPSLQRDTEGIALKPHGLSFQVLYDEAGAVSALVRNTSNPKTE
jgi:hypothetical protein